MAKGAGYFEDEDALCIRKVTKGLASIHRLHSQQQKLTAPPLDSYTKADESSWLIQAAQGWQMILSYRYREGSMQVKCEEDGNGAIQVTCFSKPDAHHGTWRKHILCLHCQQCFESSYCYFLQPLAARSSAYRMNLD